MTRLQANTEILSLLKTYLELYPDLRFGQALSNLGIATHLESYDNPDKDMVYKDIFFEESTSVLSKLKEQFQSSPEDSTEITNPWQDKLTTMTYTEKFDKYFEDLQNSPEVFRLKSSRLEDLTKVLLHLVIQKLTDPTLNLDDWECYFEKVLYEEAIRIDEYLNSPGTYEVLLSVPPELDSLAMNSVYKFTFQGEPREISTPLFRFYAESIENARSYVDPAQCVRVTKI